MGRAARAAWASPWQLFGTTSRIRSCAGCSSPGMGSVMGLWAYSVALAVYAYDVGGAKAVGIVTLVRAIPCGDLGTVHLDARRPAAARAVHGRRPTSAGLRRSAPPGPSRSPAARVARLRAGRACRDPRNRLPARRVRAPPGPRADARGADRRNVVRSTIESVGSFAGPAIGGALLAFWSPGAVMLVTAAAFVWGAVLVSLIRARRSRGPAGAARTRRRGAASCARPAAASGRSRADRRLRVVVGLYAAQTLLAGALGVLVVVTAFDLLHRGDSARRPAERGHGRRRRHRRARRVRADRAQAARLRLRPRHRALGRAARCDRDLAAHLWVALVALARGRARQHPRRRRRPDAAPAHRPAGRDRPGVRRPADDPGRHDRARSRARACCSIDVVGIRWALVVDRRLPARAGRAHVAAAASTIDAESHAPGRARRCCEPIPIFSPLPAPTLERLASELEPVTATAGADGHPAGRSR